ncbi:MAG: PIN domain-containing protein [Verrucomicrobiia bacterium]
MPASRPVVLDSYALLAYFRDESGAAVVERLLERAESIGVPVLMTEINYAEVKYMMIRKGGAKIWESCAQALPSLPIKFIPVDRSISDGAALFKAHFKLSLADACAAALAKSVGAEVVTGDPEFRQLEKVIKIRWLK